MTCRTQHWAYAWVALESLVVAPALWASPMRTQPNGPSPGLLSPRSTAFSELTPALPWKPVPLVEPAPSGDSWSSFPLMEATGSSPATSRGATGGMSATTAIPPQPVAYDPGRSDGGVRGGAVGPETGVLIPDTARDPSPRVSPYAVDPGALAGPSAAATSLPIGGPGNAPASPDPAPSRPVHASAEFLARGGLGSSAGPDRGSSTSGQAFVTGGGTRTPGAPGPGATGASASTQANGGVSSPQGVGAVGATTPQGQSTTSQGVGTVGPNASPPAAATTSSGLTTSPTPVLAPPPLSSTPVGTGPSASGVSPGGMTGPAGQGSGSTGVVPPAGGTAADATNANLVPIGNLPGLKAAQLLEAQVQGAPGQTTASSPLPGATTSMVAPLSLLAMLSTAPTSNVSPAPATSDARQSVSPSAQNLAPVSLAVSPSGLTGVDTIALAQPGPVPTLPLTPVSLGPDVLPGNEASTPVTGPGFVEPASIPEPGTLSLLGLMLLAAGARGRRLRLKGRRDRAAAAASRG